MTVVLYDYWRSTASYRVRIALNLAGIAYESRTIDLLSGAQSAPDHLKRNPQGYVPVLEIDGLRLTQSLAIIEYLTETRGLELLPEDPAERGFVRTLAQIIAADTHPICNPSVVKQVVGRLPEVERERRREEWMAYFIRRGLVAFERLLAERPSAPFCARENVSLADICLVPQIYNADRWDAVWNDLPNIARVYSSTTTLAAFADAAPEAVR
ncbi:maleylacetoacetate isomerase [Palleronia marisminoris]|uniref:maleylacetoacetate isomerase n=1 Tax=Palleronia marisminoris TaxID=315423 RepID=UPI0008E11841|nr:maleylacetoacetate isomerase [Palleronia marisminoris]SFH29848.1 maleylacetoacetate isomerase [Palleronia marisminoris]